MSGMYQSRKQVHWGIRERTGCGKWVLSFFCPISYVENYKAGTGIRQEKNVAESGGITETLFRIFDFNLQYLCGR